MKMLSIILSFLTVCLWTGCEEPSSTLLTEPPNQEEQKALEIQWATRLDINREIVGTDFTQHYGDWVLVGGDLDDLPTIKAFNTETGDLDWEYIHQGQIKYVISSSIVKDNIYIAKSSDGIFGFDLEQRKVSWEIDFRKLKFASAISFIEKDGFLYHNGTIHLNTPQSTAGMLRFDPYTGQHDFFYTQATSTGSLSAPCFWTDDNEKPYMIVNEYPNSGASPPLTSQNIMAIDMETKEVHWRTESFTEAFSGNKGHPPIIHKDIVITGGDWSIYAFDYPWSVFNKTNHLIHDGRLYVNNGQRDVTCLNPETGELIWNNPEGGSNCTDNMVYYEKEDLLVFTSWGFGSVMVLDALTGAIIHRERPYDNSQFNNDVVYDPVTDMFFTSTYKHAVGFTVKRPE